MLREFLILQKLKSIFFEAICVLKTTISSMKPDIKDQSEEQKKVIFAEQESVLNNAKMLLEKRGEIIDPFTKNNIISRGEKVFDAPKKILKSTPKKTEESVFEPIEVSKDKLDSIKLKVFRNKKLVTSIDKERYTLSDVNDLVNKIERKSISRDGAINSSNNVVKKGEKIETLRQTRNRKKLENINFKKKLFDEQPDPTDMPDLESEEFAEQNKKQKG